MVSWCSMTQRHSGAAWVPDKSTSLTAGKLVNQWRSPVMLVWVRFKNLKRLLLVDLLSSSSPAKSFRLPVSPATPPRFTSESRRFFKDFRCPWTLVPARFSTPSCVWLSKNLMSPVRFGDVKDTLRDGQNCYDEWSKFMLWWLIINYYHHG